MAASNEKSEMAIAQNHSGDGPPSKELHTPPSPVPNGGLRAWLQVLGSCLVFFNIWGLVLSFGVFDSFYQAQYLQDSSPSQIAWIGTLQVFSLNFVGIFTGPIYDLGHHNVLLYISSFMLIFGIMMLSLSTTYYQVLLSQGICMGVGSGILYVPSLALIASSFTTKRALAVTFVTAGSSVGGIVYPLVFRHLLGRVGFAWTVRIIGFIVLGVTIIAIPLIRTNQKIAGKKPRSVVDHGAFKEVPYVVCILGGFLKFLGYYIPFVYIPIYAEVRLSISSGSAFDILVYANAASLAGRLLAAWVAFRVGVMIPWTVCAFASAIICLAWLSVTNFAGIVTFAVLYGFFSGALVGLPSAVIPYVSPLNVLGTRMGMSWAIAGVALLIGSPIAGALVVLPTKNFVGLQLFCGITLLAGASLQIPLWWLIRHKITADAARQRQ